MSTISSRTAKTGLVAGVVIVVALGLGFYFRSAIGLEGGAERHPISWFIIVAAVMGAVVNEPFRHGELQQPTMGRIVAYLFWKSMVSVVFAFVLYFMFIAGLVSGDLFPRFVMTTLENGGQFQGMDAFATKVDPETNKDVAKILVWSFIAGYSERFVPNLVSQLASGPGRGPADGKS